jgi:hypothetical protein
LLPLLLLPLLLLEPPLLPLLPLEPPPLPLLLLEPPPLLPVALLLVPTPLDPLLAAPSPSSSFPEEPELLEPWPQAAARSSATGSTERVRCGEEGMWVRASLFIMGFPSNDDRRIAVDLEQGGRRPTRGRELKYFRFGAARRNLSHADASVRLPWIGPWRPCQES